MAEGPRQQGSPAGAAPPAVVAGSYNSTRDVLVLGVAFWLLFTAFQTSSFFQVCLGGHPIRWYQYSWSWRGGALTGGVRWPCRLPFWRNLVSAMSSRLQRTSSLSPCP